MGDLLLALIALGCLALLGVLWMLTRSQEMIENENDELHEALTNALKELDEQDVILGQLREALDAAHVQIDNAMGVFEAVKDEAAEIRKEAKISKGNADYELQKAMKNVAKWRGIAISKTEDCIELRKYSAKAYAAKAKVDVHLRKARRTIKCLKEALTQGIYERDSAQREKAIIGEYLVKANAANRELLEENAYMERQIDLSVEANEKLSEELNEVKTINDVLTRTLAQFER